MLDSAGRRSDDGDAGVEVAALKAVQRAAGERGAVVTTARSLSFLGEHAAAWLALGALGAAVDPHRRRRWVTATVAVAGAHGSSIVLKRIVRRPRPRDPGVAVRVGTPSRLSFPSSHATSTTAAAVLYGGLVGYPALALGVGVPLTLAMAASRLVLGVHYPTDVLAGSTLGAGCALVARSAIRRGSLGRWRTA